MHKREILSEQFRIDYETRDFDNNQKQTSPVGLLKAYWRWLSSGLLRCVVWYFTDVSEVLAASIIRAIALRQQSPLKRG
jgi:hypothetical protein